MLRALKDIAIICHEQSQEWANVGNRKLQFTLSDASITLADVTNQLETAEHQHAVAQGIVEPGETEQQKMREELHALDKFFHNLSLTDIKDLFINNKDGLKAKLKRFNFLRKLLNK